MPLGGQRQTNTMGASYRKNSMYPYAQAFLNVVQDIQNESGDSFLEESTRVLRKRNSLDTLRNFFVENSYDTNPNGMDLEEQEDYRTQMNEQFTNDIQGIL